MSHNAMGRAHLIADTLSRKFDVEIVGTTGFPKYGTDVWEPVKNSEISKAGFVGQRFPTFYTTMEEVAKRIEGDVIFVSKPRLPSYGLGILAKQFRNRPLILDLDDRELSFFGENGSLTLGEVKALRKDPEFFNPYGKLWTQYCESIIPYADHLTVSNLELQKKYGGTTFPHVKDERTFDPALYDRDSIRRKFGFTPEDRVILFVGTPKKHKGLLQVAEALEKIGDPRYKLCIIGTIGGRSLRRRLHQRGDYVRFFDNQPYSDLPANLCIGDLVCLLQDKGSEVAKYQMPSKFTDALAMELPILATDVPPLANLASRGLVELVGDTPLDQKIDEIFSVDYATYKQRAVENRRVFLEEYSYAAAAGTIERDILRLLDEIPPGAEEFGRLLEVLRESFASPVKGDAGRAEY